MSAIPTAETITAAWLTDRLRAAGHAAATVRSFSAARVGTGQIGKCIRFALDVDGADDSTPRSLVGKFPSDDPTSRATGVALRSFRKEVSFYRELQPRLKISTPRCYFADIDGDGPDFALLLEDLAPARQGDQLAGTSIETARTAVLELVGLHAPTWQDASLRGIGWLGEPDQMSVQMVQGMYRAQLPGFLERYGARLERDEAEIIAQVADSKGPPFVMLGDVFAVVHVDYRLDNLLIDETRSPARVSVVDWQTVTLGSPLSDVAYFLGAGLKPEDRRAAERDIVRAYHAGLLAAGVTGYDFERCWNDYRRGVFAGFVVTVIAAMIVQRTERGDEMFTTMARRHSRHAIDLDAQDLLA
ncbi:MAG TPA: phosphotransferase [Candidatus Binatia bacterium]|nr:phosphotransferase [Candidatus Binatia bacterium]